MQHGQVVCSLLFIVNIVNRYVDSFRSFFSSVEAEATGAYFICACIQLFLYKKGNSYNISSSGWTGYLHRYDYCIVRVVKKYGLPYTFHEYEKGFIQHLFICTFIFVKPHFITHFIPSL